MIGDANAVCTKPSNHVTLYGGAPPVMVTARSNGLTRLPRRHVGGWLLKPSDAVPGWMNGSAAEVLGPQLASLNVSDSGPPVVTLRCSVVDEVANVTPSDHVPVNGGAPLNVATAFAEPPAQRPFGAVSATADGFTVMLAGPPLPPAHVGAWNCLIE